LLVVYRGRGGVQNSKYPILLFIAERDAPQHGRRLTPLMIPWGWRTVARTRHWLTNLPLAGAGHGIAVGTRICAPGPKAGEWNRKHEADCEHPGQHQSLPNRHIVSAPPDVTLRYSRAHIIHGESGTVSGAAGKIM